MNKQWLKSRIEAYLEYEKTLTASDYARGKQGGYRTALRLIKKLDEPQQPVVPKFVAEWIEYAKKKGDSLVESFKPWDLYGAEYIEADRWIDNNQEIFARAWLNGYVVEVPIWYVKIGKGYFAGFEDTKATVVFEDAPGALEDRIPYKDEAEAKEIAEQIGGEAERRKKDEFIQT